MDSEAHRPSPGSGVRRSRPDGPESLRAVAAARRMASLKALNPHPVQARRAVARTLLPTGCRSHPGGPPPLARPATAPEQRHWMMRRKAKARARRTAGDGVRERRRRHPPPTGPPHSTHTSLPTDSSLDRCACCTSVLCCILWAPLLLTLESSYCLRFLLLCLPSCHGRQSVPIPGSTISPGLKGALDPAHVQQQGLPMPVSPSGVSGISAFPFRTCRSLDEL